MTLNEIAEKIKVMSVLYPNSVARIDIEILELNTNMFIAKDYGYDEFIAKQQEVDASVSRNL